MKNSVIKQHVNVTINVSLYIDDRKSEDERVVIVHILYNSFHVTGTHGIGAY